MDKKETITVVLEEQMDSGQNWTPLHQCLLMLLDSPLNHAGHLTVYVRLTAPDSRLIKLHREVRIPRTYKRFEQLFNNFLQGCDMPLVQTKDGPARLFQFVGKSIDKVLPNNAHRIRISNLAARLRTTEHLISPLENSDHLVFFIEFGPVDFNVLGDSRETEYEIKTINNTDKDTYSISRYPLHPALTCVKITSACEKALEIF